MMKQFLIDNWRLILEGLCAIVALIFMLVRKRPVQVVDTFKEMILSLLPYCIRVAESQPKGSKKEFCLNLLSDLLKEMGTILTDSYREFAGEQVEILLSLPQKKGTVYEKTYVK